jgi:hypothetical protein
MEKAKVLHLRVGGDVLEGLQAIASKEDRSVNYVAIRFIERALAARAPKDKKPAPAKTKVIASAEVHQVFDAWRESVESPDSKLTVVRRDKIEDRLKEGYSVKDLIEAVQGWKNDDWRERPRHNALEVLLRNAEQADKFRRLFHQGPVQKELPRAVDEMTRVNDMWKEVGRRSEQWEVNDEA